ncbi:MAG: DUF3313 family protein [Steroidobacteraceae bacterium]
MIGLRRFAACALLVAGAAVAEEAPASWDGLVEVKPKRMDATFLLPGADFRPYTKLMVDPTEVAFSKDWMKSINDQTRDLSRKVTDEDAARILESARANFDDIFREAFAKSGYEVVSTPGPDVMRVATGVVNLYLNAPDTMSAGRSRTYTTNAGEATLIIEVRDSMTGALLGRVLDRRETRSSARLQMATSVSNTSDFRILFKSWADIATKGLEELKAHSPVPMDLKPKQKL